MHRPANGIIGIDAANIRAGGGLKHLRETLGSAIDPRDHGIAQIRLYGGRQLETIADRRWLAKCYLPELDGGLVCRTFNRATRYRRLLRKENDIVYVPGGAFPGRGLDYVCTSQNMLAFERAERDRFPWSATRLRYAWLAHSHKRSFRNSVGNIYITEHSKRLIESQVRRAASVPSAIVPYGSSAAFRWRPRSQRPLSEFTWESPFELLYVSIVNQYKHQWHLVDAVRLLRDRGVPVHLTLVGPGSGAPLMRLRTALDRAPDAATYRGAVDHDDLPALYRDADGYLFGSTCETMPNVLLEAMAAGLPIVASEFGPTREILGGGGVYCDPTSPTDVADALRRMIADPELRASCAQAAFDKADEYTWEASARGIYEFLGSIAARCTDVSSVRSGLRR